MQLSLRSNLFDVISDLKAVFQLAPAEEANYRKATYGHSIFMLRVAIGLGASLYISFSWLDKLLFPEDFMMIWLIRLIVLTGFAIEFWLTFKPFFPKIHQLSIFILMLMLAGGQFSSLAITFEQAGGHSFYYTGLLLIIACAYGLTQLYFRWCLTYSILLILAYVCMGVFVMKWTDTGWLNSEGLILIFNVFFLLGMSIIGMILYITLQYFQRKDYFAQKEIEKEKKITEGLLLNILPQRIAERLKNSPDIIADEHPDVSILFTDLVGFTALSSKMNPKRLVEILNGLFSEFDALTKRYNLEKIKTIGDAYMAVGGLTIENPNHAWDIAHFALEIKEVVAQYSKTQNIDLDLRIGIHAGPVVAGVIGQSKFSFDLWGDAVNIASRMESSSLPGKIQVTEKMAAKLEANFNLLKRGNLDIKGKGSLETYFLESSKATTFA